LKQITVALFQIISSSPKAVILYHSKLIKRCSRYVIVKQPTILFNHFSLQNTINSLSSS